MSRSRRHSPVAGITTARSEKHDKRVEHHRERAQVRGLLDADPVEVALHGVPSRPRGQYWSKDGKSHYFGRPEAFGVLARK